MTAIELNEESSHPEAYGKSGHWPGPTKKNVQFVGLSQKRVYFGQIQTMG